MSIPLSPADAWQEMRLPMDWNERFSLCILFSDSHAALATMRQWVDDTWQCRTAPLTKLEPLEAANAPLEVLQGIEGHVKKLSAVRAPVWVQMLAQDGYQKNDWNQARATLLARLNESREWLINGFARPLILCFPADWQQRTPQIAPDLWHVRSFVALLKAPAPVTLLVDGGFSNSGAVLNENVNAARSTTPFHDINDAIQSTIAPLQQAVTTARARLAKSPETFNLQRELSVALSNLGDGWMEVSQPAEALRAYRESLELFRQLRESLGDSPQVLRDLSVSLEKVGDAESNAGRNDAALVTFRESLELRRQLRESLGDSPQVLWDLAVSLSRVGNAELNAGRNEAALVAYRESLELCRQLRASLGDSPQVLRDLMNSLQRVASIHARKGHIADALVLEYESLELARQLHAVVGDSLQMLTDLSIILEAIGTLENAQSNYEAAFKAYHESSDVRRQLRQVLGNSPDRLRAHIDLLWKLADVADAAGHGNESVKATAEIRQLRAMLLGTPPEPFDEIPLPTSTEPPEKPPEPEAKPTFLQRVMQFLAKLFS